MINGFVDKMIEEINSLGFNTTSPAFPTDNPKGTSDFDAIVTIQTGTTEKNLCNKVLYHEVSFRVLNRIPDKEMADSETLANAETIMNYLTSLKGVDYTNGRIITITSQTPNYAYTDDNRHVLYNTFFNAIIEGRE